VEESEDYQVKPETVVKEEGEEDDEQKPPPRKPLPGRRPPAGDKALSQKNRQPARPKPAPKKKPGQGDPCQTNEGVVGACMPAAYCYSQYSTVEYYRANMCEFSEGSGTGICCPREEPVLDAFGKFDFTVPSMKLKPSLDLPIRVPQVMKPTTKVRFISLEDINNGAKEAHVYIQKEINKERALIQRGMVQRHGSMQSMHQAFFGEFDPVQFKLTKGGFMSLVTTMLIMNK